MEGLRKDEEIKKDENGNLILEDKVFSEDGKIISEQVTRPCNQHFNNSEGNRIKAGNQKSSFNSTEHLPLSKEISAEKTELTTLLDGATTQHPANVKVVALWSYEPQHVTDLKVQKGERVTLLHRSGEWAFVENTSQEQGFIPLCYCSLIRRRSSSLTELSSELLRKISYTREEHIDRYQETYNQYRNAFTPEPGRRNIGLETEQLRKSKSTWKMPSKGTYNARKYENRMKNKKTEKGLFSLAARKLRNAFKTSTGSKQKVEEKKNAKTHIPNWLDGFQNNNSEYSSSSESSDDEEYELRRRAHSYSKTSSRRSFHESDTDHSGRLYSYNMPFHGSNDANSTHRLYPAGRQPASLESDGSSCEHTTGYATVRKLKTASSTLELGRNGHQKISLVRSSSFSHGERPRSLNLRLKPVDLIVENDNDEAFSENSFQWENNDASKPDSERTAVNAEQTEIPHHNVNEMVVLRDFTTADEKDLNVVAGQKVYILNKRNQNLWLVESVEGKAGFVPSDILTPERNENMTPTEEHKISVDAYVKDKSNASNIKLARISPTVRETLPLQEGDDEISLNDDIIDVKHKMSAQIYEFEQTESEKNELKQNERKQNKPGLVPLGKSESIIPMMKGINIENMGKPTEEPVNVYITGSIKDSAVPENFDSETGKTSRDPKLPSYEQIMSGRTETSHTLPNVGPSVVQQLLTTQHFNKEDGESSLIQALMAEFKEEQKKLGNETLLSPRDIATAETASACDSSSQTSYDSTEPMPRALRRRNSLNKKVRFQTPESTLKNRTDDNNAITNKEKLLATWL